MQLIGIVENNWEEVKWGKEKYRKKSWWVMRKQESEGKCSWREFYAEQYPEEY